MKALKTVAMIVLLVGVLYAIIAISSSQPYTTYIDGGVKVTMYPCEVTDTSPTELSVNKDNQVYSCYVTDCSLKVGDVVWCGFTAKGELVYVGGGN